MRSEAAEPIAGNRSEGLLDELAVHERNAIHRCSQLQVCDAGHVLLRANTRSHFVFFPVTAVVSIVRPLRDGRALEVGLVGNEGVCGLDAALETSAYADDVVVQSQGFVYAMPADDMRHLFEGTARLQKSLLRFGRAFLTQVMTNAVCVRFHGVRERLAKWLLMVDDRGGRIASANSRQLLASALAADDEEIDDALSALSMNDAITKRRNAIVICRDILELAACECYDAVRIGSDAASR